MKQLNFSITADKMSWQTLTKRFYQTPDMAFLHELEKALALSPTLARKSDLSLMTVDGITLIQKLPNLIDKLLICRFILRVKSILCIPLEDADCQAIVELVRIVVYSELRHAEILNQLDIVFDLLTGLVSEALIPHDSVILLASHAMNLVFQKGVKVEGLRISTTSYLLAFCHYQNARSIDAMLDVLDSWHTGSCGTFYMASIMIHALSEHTELAQQEHLIAKWSLHILAKTRPGGITHVKKLLLEILSMATDTQFVNEALLFTALFLNCLFRRTGHKGGSRTLNQILFAVLADLPEALFKLVEPSEPIPGKPFDVRATRLAQNTYLQIAELICQLAAVEDLTGECQKMVFKNLTHISSVFPQVIDNNWFHRPASIEVKLDLISISWHHWRSTGDLRPFRALCWEVTYSRVGSSEQKTKVLDMLKDKSTECSALYVTAWILTISGALGSDSQALTNTGIRLASAYFNTEGSMAGLAEAILTMRGTSLEGSFYAGLTKYFEKKQNLSNFSAHGHRSITFLVNAFLHLDLPEYAELITRCDGRYLPMCWLSYGLFVAASTTISIQRKKNWANIMFSALKAVSVDAMRILRQKFAIGLCLRTILTGALESVWILGTLLGMIASDKPSLIILETVFEKCYTMLDCIVSGKVSKINTVRVLLLTSSMRYWRIRKDRVQQLVYKLVQLDCDSLDNTERLFLTHAILNVSLGHGLFNDDQYVKIYIDSVVSIPSELRVERIQLTLDLLCANDPDGSAAPSQDKLAMKIHPGTHESTSFLSRLIESNMEAVVSSTFEACYVPSQLKMLQQAAHRGLLPIKQCISLVVSECFSSNRAQSEQALLTLSTLCERSTDGIDTLIVKGISEVQDPSTAHYQNFARCWSILQKGRSTRQRHSLLEKIGSLFRSTCLSKSRSTFLIKALQSACFSYKDACLLAHCIELSSDTEDNAQLAQLCRFLREQGNLVAPKL